MTAFDPSSPNPYKRMDWALRTYWWAIIPLLGLLYRVEVVADSWDYDGTLIVQGGFLLFALVALLYDRRAKRRKAEAADE